jgi:hypothetical protein
MLRKRDVVAVLFAVLLSQIAWNRQESLSATVHLSFYLSHPVDGTNDHTVLPAVVDLDGDDTPDTLVHIVSQDDRKSWKLKVMNIQAKQQEPFQPPVVIESSPILFQDIQPLPSFDDMAMPLMPLRMTAGHVLVKPLWKPKNTKEATSTNKKNEKYEDIADRTKRFFCGENWSDAARLCAVPCPSGTKDECPEGQKCYADTPCDHFHEAAASQQKAESEMMTFESLLTDYKNVTRTFFLSPAGGLPSVMTLWSNGVVTLHSLTAAKSVRKEKSKTSQELEIKLMWQVNILPDPDDFIIVDWTEWTISFVDAVDADNGSGLVVVSATLETLPKDFEDGQEDFVYTTLVATIDARSGIVVWRSLLKDEGADPKEQIMLPLRRGTSSTARRRSLVPNLHHHQNDMQADVGRQNCLQSSFRRPLLLSSTVAGGGALPFSYFTEDDASVRVLHFDLEQPHPHEQHPSSDKNKKTGENLSQKKKITKQSAKYRNRRNGPVHGRPNVLVTHNQEGLHVRSLKNGRSLCHLGLSQATVYADINHDGTLDSIQVAVGNQEIDDKFQEEGQVSEEADDDLRFISELAKRVATTKKGKKSQGDSNEEIDSADGNSGKRASLCHLLALSGFPSREELFSANLCGWWLLSKGLQPDTKLVAAPPLLVEPTDDGRNGWDIIAAVNIGKVSRFHGSTGRQQWIVSGNHHSEKVGNSIPHWDNIELAVLSRVDAPNAIPANRPIVLAGQDGLAILSAQSGKILASASFPQPSIRRPILVDFNGDGITDVLVQTKDAIWGFKIVVRTGSSVFLRILVGLLLMSLLLALLRNRFGPHPGKRSTDP